jgi:transcriptional regulator GlxA family with amidase domain
MNYKLNTEQDWRELARQAEWSVATLATLCGVSTRTMERHLLKSERMAPKAWLSEQRFMRAKELLVRGMSVKEVASAIGYRHATSFAREFKKLYNHPPRAIVSRPTTRA